MHCAPVCVHIWVGLYVHDCICIRDYAHIYWDILGKIKYDYAEMPAG